MGSASHRPAVKSTNLILCIRSARRQASPRRPASRSSLAVLGSPIRLSFYACEGCDRDALLPAWRVRTRAESSLTCQRSATRGLQSVSRSNVCEAFSRMGVCPQHPSVATRSAVKLESLDHAGGSSAPTSRPDTYSEVGSQQSFRAAWKVIEAAGWAPAGSLPGELKRLLASRLISDDGSFDGRESPTC